MYIARGLTANLKPMWVVHGCMEESQQEIAIDKTDNVRPHTSINDTSSAVPTVIRRWVFNLVIFN
jgi:hypothetical protein